MRKQWLPAQFLGKGPCPEMAKQTAWPGHDMIPIETAGTPGRKAMADHNAHDSTAHEPTSRYALAERSGSASWMPRACPVEAHALGYTRRSHDAIVGHNGSPW
jgi:hypothetical protein